MNYKKKFYTALFLFKRDGIKGILKRIYEKYYLYTKNYKYYSSIDPKDYKKELCKWFKLHTGQDLNLKYPRGFNQKIQYIKIYDSTPLKTRLVDKYLVKNWVAEKIGEKYITPLIGVYNTFEEINFSNLPDKFVLKGTQHGVILVEKKNMCIEEIKKKCHAFLTVNFAYLYGFELQYKDVPPRLIIEEFLEADTIYDYKVWCFHGNPEFIGIQHIDKDGNIYINFYDTDWNLQHFSSYKNTTIPIDKPKQLDELLKFARILSQGFLFVRVDFYILKDGTIKFGEMTFTPGSGIIHWNYPYADEFLGKKITLPL